MSPGPQAPQGEWQRIKTLWASRRLRSVVLLSLASGLPLGLVWTAIPAWMKTAGFDIKVVGLFTLAQAPWSFKFLWAPLMDRYAPPFMGRKRGWMLLSQVALLLLGLWLAFVSDHPEKVWVIGALALATGLAAATQDIVYDAYAVEVLHVEEQGLAGGARTALYRVGMLISGNFSITLASVLDVQIWGQHIFTWPGSWRLVNLLLALLYVPCLWLTWRAPDPETPPAAPRRLKDALWLPFLELLRQHRVLEILAFVVLFKLSDNLTQSLLKPFFVELGFGPVDVGATTGLIGTAGIIVGAMCGGLLTDRMGLGRSLWISGVLQMASNLGYALLAQVGPSRAVLYGAQGFEYLTSGLGTGAFAALLLRLTEKRFSATQFALLSSLFSIPRVLAGPPSALLVDALGWRDFFVLTVLAGVPGLLMLSRFVPWRQRELVFQVEAASLGPALSRAALALRVAVSVLGAWILSYGTLAALDGMRGAKAGLGFHPLSALMRLLHPASLGDWLTQAGIAALAVSVGLAAAALLVARRGLAPGRGQE